MNLAIDNKYLDCLICLYLDKKNDDFLYFGSFSNAFEQIKKNNIDMVIEPLSNAADLDYYLKIVDEIIKNGIDATILVRDKDILKELSKEKQADFFVAKSQKKVMFVGDILLLRQCLEEKLA